MEIEQFKGVLNSCDKDLNLYYKELKYNLIILIILLLNKNMLCNIIKYVNLLNLILYILKLKDNSAFYTKNQFLLFTLIELKKKMELFSLRISNKFI